MAFITHRNEIFDQLILPKCLPNYELVISTSKWVGFDIFNAYLSAQNGRIFADDAFCKWNVLYLVKISLKFVPKGPVDNNPALV